MATTGRQTSWWQIAVGLAILAALIFYIGTTQSFHHCIRAEKGAQEYQGLYGEIQGIVAFLCRFVVRSHLVASCEAVAIDKHNGIMAVLATAVIAWFTVSLTSATKGMLDASISQGDAMDRSIAEAARAASAMEAVGSGIAETVKINKTVIENQKDFWSRQMRAYVSVDTGEYRRQSQRIRLEFRPLITNMGATPASNVRVVSKCYFTTNGIPPEFDFSVKFEGIGQGSNATLFPRQYKFSPSIFNRKCTIAEMRQLIRGKAMFHVYGKVTYNDIFGISRFTNFSYLIDVPINKRGACIWHSSDRNNDAN